MKTIAELNLTRVILAHRKETIDGAGRVIALVPNGRAYEISGKAAPEPAAFVSG